MPSSKVIAQPLWSKIVLVILDVIMITVLIKIITGESFNVMGCILTGLMVVLWMYLTIHSFTAYQFNDYDILVKYPWGITQKYNMDDVTGCAFQDGGDGGLTFCIYFAKKTLYIPLWGSKPKSAATEFCTAYNARRSGQAPPV